MPEPTSEQPTAPEAGPGSDAEPDVDLEPLAHCLVAVNEADARAGWSAAEAALRGIFDPAVPYGQIHYRGEWGPI